MAYRELQKMFEERYQKQQEVLSKIDLREKVFFKMIEFSKTCCRKKQKTKLNQLKALNLFKIMLMQAFHKVAIMLTQNALQHTRTIDIDKK